jgi:hypothetical protein
VLPVKGAPNSSVVSLRHNVRLDNFMHNYYDSDDNTFAVRNGTVKPGKAAGGAAANAAARAAAAAAADLAEVHCWWCGADTPQPSGVGWCVFDTHRWCCACYNSFKSADAGARPAASLCPGCTGCTGLEQKSWNVKRRKKDILSSKNPNNRGL